MWLSFSLCLPLNGHELVGEGWYESQPHYSRKIFFDNIVRIKIKFGTNDYNSRDLGFFLFEILYPSIFIIFRTSTVYLSLILLIDIGCETMLQDKLLFFYWKMFHPNRLNIFAYKHYLFPYILWIHSCKGWINFQTLLCDSSISLEEKNIRTRIFAAQGDRTTTKFLCKFISGCHGWDIPLLKNQEIEYLSPSLFPFFFVVLDQ